MQPGFFNHLLLISLFELKRTFATRKGGKRHLNFATFITKERLTSPAANRYHIDIIAHVNFMAGKLNAQQWQILKVFSIDEHFMRDNTIS